MAQAKLVVILTEGITLQEGKAIRDAIMQLRGVEGVAIGETGAVDRVAYQRIKTEVARAMTEALEKLDTQGESNGEQDEAQLGRE